MIKDFVTVFLIFVFLGSAAVWTVRLSWKSFKEVPTTQSFQKMVPVPIEPVCYKLVCP